MYDIGYHWSSIHVKLDEYSNTQKERKKDKAALRWDSNTHLTHSRFDALPTELLRQLSWLSSKQASQPDKQVKSNLVLRRRLG